MDFQPLNKEQQAKLDAVPGAYATMWNSIRPPYPCDFRGTAKDIDVLDFIEYEAGSHPFGIHGAAMLWGNVLVASGAVRWVTNETGDFLLRSAEEYPSYVLWPYARTMEIEHTSWPQFGKYGWIFQKTLVDLLLAGPDEPVEKRLRALYDTDDEFWPAWSREVAETMELPLPRDRFDT